MVSGLFSHNGAPQPLCHLSLPDSFHCNGGVYPPRPIFIERLSPSPLSRNHSNTGDFDPVGRSLPLRPGRRFQPARRGGPSPELQTPILPERFDPARKALVFHQSLVTSHQSPFLSPVPLRQKGDGARMLWNVVVTPRRETSPLVPVSNSMSRADAGCGNAILPSPGQVSCRHIGWPGKHPRGCRIQRAGKAGSVRLGQHALLES
jgi:hypothetical protein